MNKYAERWNELVPKEKTEDRTLYEKDYDKVVFSQCFRRLAGKTQVHPFAHNDHVHTRLSHSLEVSIVGRSIIKKLVRLNVIPEAKKNDCIEIVMTAGLAHDMGNPPLGHIGEDAISAWVKNHSTELKNQEIGQETIQTYSSYDGNAQNFHIFKTLEYFNEKGLSEATTAALVKYPVISSQKNKKAGYFKVDEDTFKNVFQSLKLLDSEKYFRHPLSYVMEAADDICYSMMDVDDAYEIGIRGNTGKIEKLAKNLLNITVVSDNIFADIRDKRGFLIDNAVKEAAQAFKDHEEYIMNGNVSKYSSINAVPDDHKDLIKMGKKEDNYLGLILLLKDYAKDNVFGQHDKVVYETACYSIINAIFDAWFKSYSDYKAVAFEWDNLSIQSQKTFELLNMRKNVKKGDDALVQVIDYVSGMTDRYAKFIADTLSGRLTV